MHERALGEAPDGFVQDSGQLSESVQELDELTDTQSSDRIGRLIGAQQHADQAVSRRFDVATLQEIDGLDAVEPRQCAQLAVVGDARASFPVRHHRTADTQSGPHIVLGVPRSPARASENLVEQAHLIVPLQPNVLRDFP